MPNSYYNLRTGRQTLKHIYTLYVLYHELKFINFPLTSCTVESKRKSRNQSEKRRRDAFNLLVTDLASMVTAGDRKLDKSNVLLKTIDFLKSFNQTSLNSFGSTQGVDTWKPSFLSNDEFCHLLLEATHAFTMAIASTGKIIFVSDTVSRLLGFLPEQLMQFSIFDIVDSSSGVAFQRLFSDFSSDISTSSSDCQQLSCQMRDAGGNWENVHITGNTSRIGYSSQAQSPTNSPSETSETVVCFVAVCQLENYWPDLTVTAQCLPGRIEFTARLDTEWKYIYLDERTPSVVGYYPFDLLGTSGYDRVHPDDVVTLAASHQDLLRNSHGTSPAFRFLTKGNQWLWLQTRYYITYHQWNSKPEFIVCTNNVIRNPEFSSSGHSISIQNAGSSSRKRAVFGMPDTIKVPRFTGLLAERSPSALNTHPGRLADQGIETPTDSVDSTQAITSCSEAHVIASSSSSSSLPTQPGVSIEHVPIPLTAPPKETPRKSTLATLLQLGKQEMRDDNILDTELRIKMQLVHRQAELERQIRDQEFHLLRLRQQLCFDVPTNALQNHPIAVDTGEADLHELKPSPSVTTGSTVVSPVPVNFCFARRDFGIGGTNLGISFIPSSKFSQAPLSLPNNIPPQLPQHPYHSHASSHNLERVVSKSNYISSNFNIPLNSITSSRNSWMSCSSQGLPSPRRNATLYSSSSRSTSKRPSFVGNTIITTRPFTTIALSRDKDLINSTDTHAGRNPEFSHSGLLLEKMLSSATPISSSTASIESVRPNPPSPVFATTAITHQAIGGAASVSCTSVNSIGSPLSTGGPSAFHEVHRPVAITIPLNVLQSARRPLLPPQTPVVVDLKQPRLRSPSERGLLLIHSDSTNSLGLAKRASSNFAVAQTNPVSTE